MKNEKKIEMNFEEENEFAVRDELCAKRKSVKSFNELVDFLKYIEENCNTGYGTAPRAIAQAALAVSWYLSDKFGITGFQAGCIMWDFVMDWTFRDNKCGLKIVDYDNMLYPQYDHTFEKTISPDVWKALQEQASENLKENTSDEIWTAHPNVVAHWQSIVDGKIPFGYSISVSDNHDNVGKSCDTCIFASKFINEFPCNKCGENYSGYERDPKKEKN